jgi:transposase-like protein
MKEFLIHNCPYCGATCQTKVFARLESFTCASCGSVGVLSDEGLWSPPPKAQEVRLAGGGFALSFPEPPK